MSGPEAVLDCNGFVFTGSSLLVQDGATARNCIVTEAVFVDGNGGNTLTNMDVYDLLVLSTGCDTISDIRVSNGVFLNKMEGHLVMEGLTMIRPPPTSSIQVLAFGSEKISYVFVDTYLVEMGAFQFESIGDVDVTLDFYGRTEWLASDGLRMDVLEGSVTTTFHDTTIFVSRDELGTNIVDGIPVNFANHSVSRYIVVVPWFHVNLSHCWFLPFRFFCCCSLPFHSIVHQSVTSCYVEADPLGGGADVTDFDPLYYQGGVAVGDGATFTCDDSGFSEIVCTTPCNPRKRLQRVVRRNNG